MTSESGTPGLPLAAARQRPHDIAVEQARHRVRSMLFGGVVRPTLLGPYRVEHRLGAGGMGVVHAAFDPRLKRRVALKLLAADRVEDADARQRFRDEAKVMAQLSHPNVVRVFDVGQTGSLLYIAMELIDGQTLAQWATLEPRDVAEVLRVFTEAGRGLAAAHRARVVHRDFKPHNVLIDEGGRVRVTDFGLARLVVKHSEQQPQWLPRAGGEVGSATTEPGRSGTARYMSPEQRRGDHLDGRSDQYSFCVALYESLHGCVPAENAEAAPGRAEVPRRVAKALARGLADDRAQRFPSMEALLAALTRRKSRTRATVVAVPAVVCAVAWAAYPRPQWCATALEQGRSMWTAERGTTLHATVAEIEGAATYSVASQVVADIDRLHQEWVDAYAAGCAAVDSGQTPPGLPSTLACLDERHAQVMAMASALDEVAAERLGGVAQWLGAQSMDTPCDGNTPGFSPWDPAEGPLSTAMAQLRASTAQTMALVVGGRYEDAAELSKQMVMRARVLDDPAVLAQALAVGGRILQLAGDEDAAEEAAVESAALATATGRDAEAAATWTSAVSTAIRRGQFEVARERVRLAEAALQRAEPNGVARAKLLGVQGVLEFTVGQYDRAVELLQRAIDVWPGNDNVMEIAGHRLFLGQALLQQGRTDEAFASVQRGTEDYAEIFGQTHPARAAGLVTLGRMYLLVGRYAEGAGVLEQARDVLDTAAGARLPTMPRALTLLGMCLSFQGHDDLAIAHAERAFTLSQTLHGETSPRTADAEDLLANVLLHAGQLDRARRHARGGLRTRESIPAAGYVALASSWTTLGVLEAAEGDHATALATLTRALEHCDDGPNRGGLRRIRPLAHAAKAAYVLGRTERARAHASQALELATQLGQRGADPYLALLTLSHVERDAGETGRAIELARAAQERARVDGLGPRWEADAGRALAQAQAAEVAR